MKHNEQKLTTVKESPQRQLSLLLDWFSRIQVNSFDIHVRRKHNSEMNSSQWITCHEGLDCHRLQKLWSWMRYENAKGGDIYFRPHRHDAHPVIFLDDLNLKTASLIAKKYACFVIETSRNNTQVWLKCDKRLSRIERKKAQCTLSNMGYSDPGSISGDHLGRMCGMMSQKRRCWVNGKLFSTPQAYSPSHEGHSHTSRGGGARVLSFEKKNSFSEREFGWVIGMLKSGMDLNSIRSKLLNQAIKRGKNGAESYASLTTQKASSIVNT